MKNIKLSKFTLLQVQMWDSSIIHALSWIFMKKYQSFKFHLFPGSNVRFKYYSCAFMNFHEKISNFQSSFFSQFRCEIQVLFMRFHAQVTHFIGPMSARSNFWLAILANLADSPPTLSRPFKKCQVFIVASDIGPTSIWETILINFFNTFLSPNIFVIK